MGWFEIFYTIVFPVILIFGAGYVLGRIFHWHHQTLSTLSLYLLTPALIFQAIYSHPEVINAYFLRLFLAVTCVIALSFGLVLLVSRFFGWDERITRVVVLTVTLANTGNFGLPITEAAFGGEGLAVASLLLVIYSFYTHSFGVFLAAREKFHWKDALRSMAGVPVFYAILLALFAVWFRITIPEPIFKPIQMVGLSAIPLNLIQVGLQLASVRFGKQSFFSLAVALVKLVIVPFVAILFFGLFGVKKMYFNAGLLQVAMPSAVYTAILTSHYGGKADLASEIVFISILLSTVTLTVWISLLQRVFF
ncbi:AEC family transporter [Thermospira aquatica]|uniref:AEC family transporter n=1 Tax=Thermospira aquatica TaxID=2828656 RepID=A0AAX3BCG1_9SPIR|nr:AEC family transporter [Thermospira aquatica]URA09840.1 AEC family transporter [Thermospira aquatica]